MSAMIGVVKEPVVRRLSLSVMQTRWLSLSVFLWFCSELTTDRKVQIRPLTKEESLMPQSNGSKQDLNVVSEKLEVSQQRR